MFLTRGVGHQAIQLSWLEGLEFPLHKQPGRESGNQGADRVGFFGVPLRGQCPNMPGFFFGVTGECVEETGAIHPAFPSLPGDPPSRECNGYLRILSVSPEGVRRGLI